MCLGNRVKVSRKPGKLFRKPGKLFFSLFQKAETGLTFFSFFLSFSLSFLILRSPFLVLVLVIFIYMTSHNMTSQIYPTHEFVKDTDRIPSDPTHAYKISQFVMIEFSGLVLTPFQTRINFAQ